MTNAYCMWHIKAIKSAAAGNPVIFPGIVSLKMEKKEGSEVKTLLLLYKRQSSAKKHYVQNQHGGTRKLWNFGNLMKQ